MKKSSLLIGLLESLGVTIYCALIAGILFLMEKYLPEPPQYFAMAIILVILVFSAAITGSIVFGYPVYLILKENKVKEGLQALGYFALFLLGIIIVSLVLIAYFI